VSLDLYQRETARVLTELRPVSEPEPSVWDGFFRGVGTSAMRRLAQFGSAIDMAGAVGPIVQDAFTGGTEAQDRYFREHEEFFGSAVDHWTVKPGEVGVAGQVVGDLLATLPVVIASPALAIGGTQLAVGEELVRKDVEPGKAQAVGAVQAAGLGLGIWVPILGQNLWQRVVLGGAGFNLVQGTVTRGTSQAILEGTLAAKDFQPWDPAMLTLDVLLGAAFGTLAHLSPAQRAQGAAYWERIRSWGETLSPSQVEAVAALRQAQHLNVDSVGGTPASVKDIDLHVARIRTAIDQLASDRRVDVSDLPTAKVEADGRFVEAKARGDDLLKIAERVRVEEGLAPVPEAERPPRAEIPAAPEAEIVSPIDRAATQAEKVRQLGALSQDNAPTVNAFLKDLDARLGTESKSSFKEPAKILAKATRPEIVQSKPWFAVEHIRDAFRFKTVLGDMTQLPQIAEAIKEQGWEVVKVDVDKLFAPKQWGWRFAAVDLRMPNGQIVEYYMPVRELEAAKKAGGHADFEAWRDVNITKLESEKATEFYKAVEQSYTRYEQALAAYLKRTGQTEADLRSSAARFSEALRDIGVKPEAISAPVTGKEAGLPSTKVRILSGETTTSTVGSVLETKTKAPTAGIVPDIEAQLRGLETELEGGRPDPLAVEAARVVAEQPDLEITLGRDPDGTPQTVKAKQFLEDARADVEQARQDARLFEIAAGCLLT